MTVSVKNNSFGQTISIMKTKSKSLNNLMVTLKRSRPYFIRCIKSNSIQQEMIFDDYLVREQLISSGMEETVRLKQSSYPIRMEHKQFCRTYQALIGQSNTRQQIREKILELLGLKDAPKVASSTFQVGRTLVFLKESSKTLLDQKECGQKWSSRWLFALTIVRNLL